jgi:hypothetical protein
MARSVLNNQGAFDARACQNVIDTDAFQGPISVLSGSADAINPHLSGNYEISTAGVDAMTILAPTSGVDDNLSISIFSTTLYAHTLTSVALFQTGASGTNVLTFAAYAGAGVTLRAYKGFWQLVGQCGITVSS